MIEASVIEDSISEAGKRITTLQVRFHRFCLPEFNTHRVFSRNFSSSRAIPTAKLIEQVRTQPAMPVHWGKNQPGMQAKEELSGSNLDNALQKWVMSAGLAADMAEAMADVGAHKQIVNRIIEPYLWANGIVTSTEWANWFELRAHEDAQPEIHELALKMRDAINNSDPKLLKHGEWHLPYVSVIERCNLDIDLLKKISAARCCRVSYLKHDGSAPNIDDDLALFNRLAGAVPLHASPLEHQATPDKIFIGGIYMGEWANRTLHGNLDGWVQHRKLWEQEIFNQRK